MSYTPQGNLRRDPRTKAYNYVQVTPDEEFFVEEFEELPGVFGFQLSERPDPNNIIVTNMADPSTPYEVTTSQNPVVGQVYIDYVQGYCIFNPAEYGEQFSVNYKGAGPIAHFRNLALLSTFAGKTSDDLDEGATNLYMTSAEKSKLAGLPADADNTADNLDAAMQSEAGLSLAQILAALWPVGSYLNHGGRTAPTGFLACDRSSVSRITYANLFNVLCESCGTVTMTIASPCVVTLAAHGFAAGDAFFFETTGALPTGVSANTQYFVLSTGLTTDTFRFAATAGGTAINTSGSQSGTHTLRMCQHGIADASTFRVPDARGLFVRGAGAHGTMTKSAGGAFDGGSVGATSNDSMHGHQHPIDDDAAAYGNGTPYFSQGSRGTTQTTRKSGNPASDGTNGTPRTGDETKPASMSLLVCIKY